jgi:hypothetical protein
MGIIMTYLVIIMVLDLTMRGVLEQYIDAVVIEIPNIVTVFFDHLRKAQLQIQNERDFALGIALGNIQHAFLTYLDYIQRRPPNHEELTQIAEIIFKRTAEIRSAIFNAT